MVELDRWAIARMKSLQEEILDKYDHYQFHTAYAALQLFASGDLGGFYLDILRIVSIPLHLTARLVALLRPLCGTSRMRS